MQGNKKVMTNPQNGYKTFAYAIVPSAISTCSVNSKKFKEKTLNNTKEVSPAHIKETIYF